ncbi:MAG: hypothetical protein WCG08_15475 [Paludibacter sp.]
MENEFEKKLQAWLEDVAITCDKYAREIDRDFYPFQSNVFENPELLIIGANPGNEEDYKSFIEKNKRGRLASELSNCGENGENAYIAYKDDPKWKINKPILKMFETPKMRTILENAVIMNVVYFNTVKVEDLKTYNSGGEIIKACVDFTYEFVYNILKPKNILLLGEAAPKWMKISYNYKNDTILWNKSNQWLIQNKMVNQIPHYKIYHPSMNFAFNSGENLRLKKEKFELIFGAI